MALSPADFYAYSQATGAPVPENPSQRAAMAPEVLAFRRNQLKAPQQSQEQGFDPLSVGVGVGLALAGGIGAGLGVRKLLRGPKQSANAGVRQANLEKFAAETSPVRRAVQETQVEPSKVAGIRATGAPETDIEYVSPYRKGPTYQDVYPSRFEFPKISEETIAARREASQQQAALAKSLTPGTYQMELGGPVSPTLMQLRSSEFGPNLTETRRQALGLAEQYAPSVPLSEAPNQLDIFKYSTTPQRDVAQELVDEYVRNAGLETKRQQKIQRDIATQKEGMAMRVIDQLRQEAKQEAAQPKGFNPRKYIEQTGAVAPAEDLTSLQQLNEGQVIDQKINAVESGEDQMTGRVRQQLQRNEDLNLNQIDALEDVTGNMDAAASQTSDGLPVDQIEIARTLSSQELADLAKEEMISLRQQVAARGLRPGTQRFENALAQAWVDKSISGATPGTQKFQELQAKGKINISLPTIVRKAVEAESAGAGPTGMLPERTLANVGPEAQIESTAAGTAIRGVSPSSQEVPPKEELRQLYGTKDPLLFGVPTEMGPDISGAMRTRASMSTDIPETEQSKQEIVYSFLNRPQATEIPGGAAGTGIYGLERAYVPGAMSKTTGQYSAAAERKPTEVPKWILKKEITPFSNISTEGLLRAQEKSTKTGAFAIQSEIERRQRTKESVTVSEVLRRARIEGRDPQDLLGPLPPSQGPTESPIDFNKYFQYNLFTKNPPKEAVATQLNLPSDVVPSTSETARARVTPADIAANQLEQYMSKLQKGRSTPLTSEVRIQPRLF